MAVGLDVAYGCHLLLFESGYDIHIAGRHGESVGVIAGLGLLDVFGSFARRTRGLRLLSVDSGNRNRLELVILVGCDGEGDGLAHSGLGVGGKRRVEAAVVDCHTLVAHHDFVVADGGAPDDGIAQNVVQVNLGRGQLDRCHGHGAVGRDKGAGVWNELRSAFVGGFLAPECGMYDIAVTVYITAHGAINQHAIGVVLHIEVIVFLFYGVYWNTENHISSIGKSVELGYRVHRGDRRDEGHRLAGNGTLLIQVDGAGIDGGGGHGELIAQCPVSIVSCVVDKCTIGCAGDLGRDTGSLIVGAIGGVERDNRCGHSRGLGRIVNRYRIESHLSG